jgi:hypothetical protein
MHLRSHFSGHTVLCFSSISVHLGRCLHSVQVNNIKTNFGGCFAIMAGLGPANRTRQRHWANGEIFASGDSYHCDPVNIHVGTSARNSSIRFFKDASASFLPPSSEWSIHSRIHSTRKAWAYPNVWDWRHRCGQLCAKVNQCVQIQFVQGFSVNGSRSIGPPRVSHSCPARPQQRDIGAGIHRSMGGSIRVISLAE